MRLSRPGSIIARIPPNPGTCRRAFGTAILGLVALTGCDAPGAAPPQAAERPTVAAAHEHIPGSHGGIIVPIDGNHTHVEAIFTADGAIKLHMLGEDETRVLEVETQSLTAFIRPKDSISTKSIEMEADPQEGDAPGKTSAFAGRLPEEWQGKPLIVVVPSIRIDGERLRFSFESPEVAAHEPAMPAKVADEAERDLYLTPGGKYTEADIEANGRHTASEKFAGFRAEHDPSPAPGSRLCPITQTKANPACSWIIGGKTYEFCCPPCVDEFVRAAKESPELIKDPSDYVQE